MENDDDLPFIMTRRRASLQAESAEAQQAKVSKSSLDQEAAPHAAAEAPAGVAEEAQTIDLKTSAQPQQPAVLTRSRRASAESQASLGGGRRKSSISEDDIPMLSARAKGVPKAAPAPPAAKRKAAASSLSKTSQPAAKRRRAVAADSDDEPLFEESANESDLGKSPNEEDEDSIPIVRKKREVEPKKVSIKKPVGIKKEPKSPAKGAKKRAAAAGSRVKQTAPAKRAGGSRARTKKIKDEDEDGEEAPEGAERHFKEGQRVVCPAVGDAHRAFYESLLSQNPYTIVGIKWCIERGCLIGTQLKETLKKYHWLRQAGAFRAGKLGGVKTDFTDALKEEFPVAEK